MGFEHERQHRKRICDEEEQKFADIVNSDLGASSVSSENYKEIEAN